MSKLGIVAPMPSEAGCLSGGRHATGELVTLAEGVLMALSGVGAERAHEAAWRLIDHGAEALVSFGCAGGLAPQVAVGELCLPRTVLAPDGRSLETHAPWRAALAARVSQKAHAGALVESPRVLKTPEQKAEAFGATGALAVDMESASVATVAAGADLPFLVVRAVCDGHSMRVPRASLLAVDEHGELRLGRLAKALVRQPGELVATARLDLGFRAAQRTLRDVARTAGVGLAWDAARGGERAT